MATQRLLFLTPAQAVTGIFPALRDAGFELGIAENLKGASAFISKSGPGIIFARPTLPGFRVEDLLAVGAEDPHFPPVIVVADKGSPQEAERLLNLGARDYWLEPLDVERVKIAAGAARRQPAPAPAASTLGGRRPSAPRARARASWATTPASAACSSWPARWPHPAQRCSLPALPAQAKKCLPATCTP